MPIYYAVYTYFSDPETYWWPLNREIPLPFAASLKWAVSIGYVLPTVLIFVPWSNQFAMQNFEALWQPSPMYVPLLCTILGYVYRKRHNFKEAPKKAAGAMPDIAHLEKLYIFTGVLGLLLHVYCIGKIVASPGMSLTSVFWPDFTAEPKSLGEGLRNIFLSDFWGFEIATFGWQCMAVWDLIRVGRTAVDMGKATAIIALSNVVMGPGATLSAVWYWREQIMAKTAYF